MRATLAEKREVAKGTLLAVFDLGGEEVDFEPGQYFFVTLLDPPYEDEKGPRRHITVVTSPSERGVLGLCTRLRDSAFKRSLAELPLGAEVEVEPPKGKFLLPKDTSRAVRLRRRRDRDHRLPQHAPYDGRRGPAVPGHAPLLESQSGRDGLHRRAAGARDAAPGLSRRARR